MVQFLATVGVILGGVSYFLYEENKELSRQLSSLETAIEQQEETISFLQKNKEKQNNALLELQEKNVKAEREVLMYLDIFARHSLSKLAAAKPGLVEKRVNNATKDVFDSIEHDSRNLSNDGMLVE